MLAPIVLGIAQGARHSLEPDHIAAVSTLLGDSRSVRRSAWLGAIWGIGHTVSLVAICVAVVGFGAMLPPEADRAFTLAVAVLLVALGVRSLWQTGHPDPSRAIRGPLQALAIGAIHGMAGSSALTAMVFATLPSSAARLVYITLFGLGSVVGMALISGSAGLWLGRIRRSGLMTALRVVIGMLSIAIGVNTGVAALTHPTTSTRAMIRIGASVAAAAPGQRQRRLSATSARYSSSIRARCAADQPSCAPSRSATRSHTPRPWSRPTSSSGTRRARTSSTVRARSWPAANAISAQT
jgi:high-affinity nickel-transport protein